MDLILDRRIKYHYLISIVVILSCGVFIINAQSKENNFLFAEEKRLWDEYLNTHPSIYPWIHNIYIEGYLSPFFTEVEKNINKRIHSLNEYFVIVEQSLDNGVNNVYLIYPDANGTEWLSLVWVKGSYNRIINKTVNVPFSIECSPDELFSYYTNVENTLGATFLSVKYVKNANVYRQAFYLRMKSEIDELKIQRLLELCCGNSDLLQ